MATFIARLLGPLVDVLIGGAIAVRSQSSAFSRERRLRLRTEKRGTYLRFVAAARSWQAATLNHEVKIMDPPYIEVVSTPTLALHTPNRYVH
jgi:hypothetical protein